MVGWFAGFWGGFVLAHVIPLGNVMLGIGTGVAVGYLQWRVLRGIVARSGWWTAASTLGPTVALAIYAVVNAVTGYPFDLAWSEGALGWALALLVGGALTGMWQQRILRPHLGGSGWWIPASAVGWGLGILATSALEAISGPPAIAGPLLSGAVLGAVTGYVLLRMSERVEEGEVGV